MGKPTGFLDHKRKNFSYGPVEARLKNYNEFVQQLDEKDLNEQGARCMDCGIPYCHSMGCPVYNLIPEWNDFVYKNQWKEAYERLERTNNFPEVTGRICPAPCETSCTLSINDAPVTIKQIELAIIERAFKEGWVNPRAPEKESGKKVAVIGSGPAGLAAAQQLRRLGHQVTVYEKSNRLGGLLRYGIPDFKLEKKVLDRRIEQMKAEGIVFETSVNAGVDVKADMLKKNFDAVLLATGSGTPRDLNVPGRELKGVHYAMEFLTGSNQFVDKQIASPVINAKDKTVIVIGGGDTGSDCVGTSNRQGAKKVYQFEIMPKPMEWKEARNPVWPAWPQILRTSSSHEEGCERDWCINTKSLEGENGVLKKANFVRIEWVKDEKGQFQMKEIPGSEFSIEADLIFLAMGFVHVEHSELNAGLKVAYDPRGNVQTAAYASSTDGVFAAGDSATGASLVVRAIFHGRQSAMSINRYLAVKK